MCLSFDSSFIIMNIDMDSVIVSSLTEHCYGPSSSLPLFSPLLLLLLTPSLLPFYSCFLTSNPSHSLSFPHLSILTPSLLTTPLTSLLSSPLFSQLTLFCILYPVSSFYRILSKSRNVWKRCTVTCVLIYQRNFNDSMKSQINISNLMKAFGWGNYIINWPTILPR